MGRWRRWFGSIVVVGHIQQPSSKRKSQAGPHVAFGRRTIHRVKQQQQQQQQQPSKTLSDESQQQYKSSLWSWPIGIVATSSLEQSTIFSREMNGIVEQAHPDAPKHNQTKATRAATRTTPTFEVVVTNNAARCYKYVQGPTRRFSPNFSICRPSQAHPYERSDTHTYIDTHIYIYTQKHDHISKNN